MGPLTSKRFSRASEWAVRFAFFAACFELRFSGFSVEEARLGLGFASAVAAIASKPMATASALILAILRTLESVIQFSLRLLSDASLAEDLADAGQVVLERLREVFPSERLRRFDE